MIAVNTYTVLAFTTSTGLVMLLLHLAYSLLHTTRSVIQFKCPLQDNVYPSQTKNYVHLRGWHCPVHLLKVRQLN
jgi:hypothetical protein